MFSSYSFRLLLVQIRELDSHKIVAAAGPQADCVQFLEYIKRNIALKEFRSGLKASTKGIANFVQTELATALRKNPYQVDMLLGGYDQGEGASMFFIDYLGAMVPINYGAHGYAKHFISATMDRHWRPKMNLEEALDLARKCIKELHTRFIINQPTFIIKVADENGIREVPL